MTGWAILHRNSVVAMTLLAALTLGAANARSQERDFSYREIEGTVLEFDYHRQWRHYYWREDFTMVVRDDAGQTHRVISREPTPWNDLRFGTTYLGVDIDWSRRPRVKIVGVRGADRIPAEFYDLKLTGEEVTAFIVRV